MLELQHRDGHLLLQNTKQKYSSIPIYLSVSIVGQTQTDSVQHRKWLRALLLFWILVENSQGFCVGLFEEYYNKQQRFCLILPLLYPVWEQIYRLLYNIDPFALVLQLEKNFKAIPGPDFFHLSDQVGKFWFCHINHQLAFLFQVINNPRNFHWASVLLDSCLCCYSPSLLGPPPHWVVLAALFGGWQQVAGLKCHSA